MDDTCQAAKSLLEQFLKHGALKAQLLITLTFVKENIDGETTSEKAFRSVCEPLLLGDDIEKFLRRGKAYIKARIEEYERHGSGWTFQKFHCSHLEVAKYSPLSASGMVEIPQKLKNMRSVLNISSTDNKCLLYCLLAKLHPVKKHADRFTKYLDHVDSIDLCNVEFPIKITDIVKIEEKNNLSISVFEWNEEDKCIDPLKHGTGIGTQIELLYIENGLNAHYLLIKDFNAFMRHRTKHHNSMFYCLKCMHGFTSEALLDDHATRCKQGVFQMICMPNEGSLKFKAVSKQERKQYVMYCDFEALTMPISGCSSDPSRSSTFSYQKHEACSFSIVTKSEYDDFDDETIVYSHKDPENVTKTFVTELFRLHDKMMTHYATKQHPIDMTESDQKAFKSSTHCHICKRKLKWYSKKNYPVRDP